MTRTLLMNGACARFFGNTERAASSFQLVVVQAIHGLRSTTSDARHAELIVSDNAHDRALSTNAQTCYGASTMWKSTARQGRPKSQPQDISSRRRRRVCRVTRDPSAVDSRSALSRGPNCGCRRWGKWNVSRNAGDSTSSRCSRIHRNFSSSAATKYRSTFRSMILELLSSAVLSRTNGEVEQMS